MEKDENLEKINKKEKVQSSKKIDKILNIISQTICNTIFIILLIITCILVYNVVQVSILGKPYMDIFGYSAFQVKTGSMAGTIEIGDIVVVKLTDDVTINDIVTYEQKEMLITHRIIEKEGNTIITKGDANNVQDEPITQENIIGKVIYTFENVEIWKNVFTTPEVYIPVIITLILFGITISIGNKKEQE